MVSRDSACRVPGESWQALWTPKKDIPSVVGDRSCGSPDEEVHVAVPSVDESQAVKSMIIYLIPTSAFATANGYLPCS